MDADCAAFDCVAGFVGRTRVQRACAPLTGLEPATSWLTTKRSDQLSYSSRGVSSRGEESNSEPIAYKAIALPVELPRPRPRGVSRWSARMDLNHQSPRYQRGGFTVCLRAGAGLAACETGVGLLGFEPRASASQTQRSDQAELQPDDTNWYTSLVWWSELDSNQCLTGFNRALFQLSYPTRVPARGLEPLALELKARRSIQLSYTGSGASSR